MQKKVFLKRFWVFCKFKIVIYFYYYCFFNIDKNLVCAESQKPRMDFHEICHVGVSRPLAVQHVFLFQIRRYNSKQQPFLNW